MLKVVLHSVLNGLNHEDSYTGLITKLYTVLEWLSLVDRADEE